MWRYLVVFICFGVIPVFACIDEGAGSEFDAKIALVKKLGSASIELANKDIEIELTDNSIVWVQSENKIFDAYVNQGVAYLHVFHFIDALRSFKMAHQIDPQSLYPVAGMIFSYMRLSPMDSAPLVEKLLLTSKQCVDSAGQKEKMWYDLAVAVFLKKTGLFLEERYQDATSLMRAYLRLSRAHPNDVEVLTLGTYMAGGQGARDEFLKALEIQPDHTGANHYLLHFMEYTGRAAEALQYAQVLYKNASYNAHAVHMLGHILPIVGRWSEAKSLFEEANEIHLAWAEKNKVSPEEDWHYYHNLHLLSMVHIGLGELEEGYKVLKSICDATNFGSYFCIQLYVLHNIMEDLDVVQERYNQVVVEYPQSRQHLQRVMDEVALLKGAAFSEMSENSRNFPHLILVDRIMQSQDLLIPPPILRLIDDIEEYIESYFTYAAFDNWVFGLLNSLRILSVTARIKDKMLYEATLSAIRKTANEFDFDLYNHVESVKKNRLSGLE